MLPCAYLRKAGRSSSLPPDCSNCIMAPEVTCIAGNNLLSRAALNGGVPPVWDADRADLKGFLRL